MPEAQPVPLIRSGKRHCADQVREMGLKVGDVIVGREGRNGWWGEQRLTLLYIGEQICVWRSENRTDSQPEFQDCGEAAGWGLECRDWYLVKTPPDIPSLPQ